MPTETEEDTAPQPAPPVVLPALPYALDAGTPLPLETRLIILAAAASGMFGLISFVTSLWIYFQPTLFTTVGGPRSLRSFEFALLAWNSGAGAALVAGGGAFLARRNVCRPLLLAGAAALLVGQVVGMAYYAFFSPQPGVSRSGADVLVMALWRTGWFFNAGIVPALTLLTMTRPQVKARFGK